MATALNRQIKAARKHYEVLSASPALRSPYGYLEQRKKALEMVKNRMISAQIQGINQKKQRYIACVSKLDAMSPLKVLTRGYAMAQSENGMVIKSVKQVKPGDSIHVAISDGVLTAQVSDVKEND
jgi:exodeoxyribonuclease VII large subunit